MDQIYWLRQKLHGPDLLIKVKVQLRVLNWTTSVQLAPEYMRAGWTGGMRFNYFLIFIKSSPWRVKLGQSQFTSFKNFNSDKTRYEVDGVKTKPTPKNPKSRKKKKRNLYPISRWMVELWIRDYFVTMNYNE